MPRNPQIIAAEARKTLDAANTTFVPVNVVKSFELAVEFMESTVKTLDAAGLLPVEPKAEATEAPAA